jgi:adenine-specific DNA-methyltransferase
MGKEYSPGSNQHWKINKEGLDNLSTKGLLIERTNSLAYYMFLDDFPISPIMVDAFLIKIERRKHNERL